MDGSYGFFAVKEEERNVSMLWPHKHKTLCKSSSRTIWTLWSKRDIGVIDSRPFFRGLQIRAARTKMSTTYVFHDSRRPQSECVMIFDVQGMPLPTLDGSVSKFYAWSARILYASGEVFQISILLSGSPVSFFDRLRSTFRLADDTYYHK